MKSAIILLLFYFNISFCQQSSNVLFVPKVGNSPLIADNVYQSDRNTNFSVSTLKFFISDFNIVFADGTEINSNDSWLMDLENKESFGRTLPIPEKKVVKSLRFTVGVPVDANTAGALGGDLDPASGMYWSWQSGYINFKIEGRSPVCKTHNSEFSFHIGGYKLTEQSARQVVLLCPSGYITGKVMVYINLHKLLEVIDLKTKNTVNTPGTEAMEMADLISKIFSVNE